MLENGAPPDTFGVLYRLLHIEFHGFNSNIKILGLSHLVPGINSIFFRWHGSLFNQRHLGTLCEHTMHFEALH